MAHDHKHEEHYHKDEQGMMVKCYHKCKTLLTEPAFWIGMTLNFPIEHFIWEHIWPFKLLTAAMG